MGFHAVAQGERGAGIDGVGGVEGLAQFGAGDGLAWYGQRVKPDVQGVVAGVGRCGANEGVGLFVGAGMARIGDDWAIVFDGDLAEVAYHVPLG